MSNLIAEMESDVRTPTIGDNSLKEMADLCAEQVALEEEMEQLAEQLKAKATAARKLSQEIIPARMSELASNFIDKIEELGYNIQPQQKVWVEPMTLKAFVREQIANGSELPTDKFGVFVGAETKISKT
jgi:hypothetical protein